MITGILIAVLLAFGAYIYKFPPRKPINLPIKNDKICMDYPDIPMSELSVDLIHTMVNKYRDNQLKCINNNLSDFKEEGDAHSVWFDLDTLKRFIYHIEKTTINTVSTTSKNTIKDMKITKEKLGIRIYYSAYPNITEWDSFTDLVTFLNADDKFKKERLKYGNLHTIVMIPTLNINGEMKDFNPLDEDTYPDGLFDRSGYTFNPVTPVPTNRTMGLSGTAHRSSSSQNSGAQNHGTLIPPVTSGGQEGFGI